MHRPLTPWIAFVLLLVLVSAIGAMSMAFVAVFDGNDWQAILFGFGATLLALWSAFRFNMATGRLR